MAIKASFPKPISRPPSASKYGLAIFGAIFALMGFAFLVPTFCLPVVHIVQAQGWREVPCTIIHSEVVSHADGDDGPTYSLKIDFSYNFGDIHYVGTHYDFSVGSSNLSSHRQATVRRLPPGAHTVCYVDPNHPAQAVIDRGLNHDMWFALIPLIFVAIGVLMVGAAVRSAHPRALPSATGNQPLRNNPASLKESTSPVGKLIGIGAIALFWNGIVSVFVYQGYIRPSAGHAVWFLRIFLIPFILVGLSLIGAWFYQLLALFNPRPHVVLTNSALSLGQTSELRWNFSGNFSRISRLKILVEGREQARYQRGTSTYTDNNTFARVRIADTTRQADIASGRGMFSIPADTMHSFAATNNKIIWAIVVRGEISGWPDVKSEFPINVAPLPAKKVQ